jgi:apolipoprotein N-acyltransferase
VRAGGASERGALHSMTGALRAVPVPLVSGVGLALSIPPWGFWILAFPAAALLWWQLGSNRPRLRRRLWIGFVAGLGLFGPGLFWATSFNVYGGIILIVVEALALALAGGACGSGSGRIVALPGAMVLAEWLRDIWPFGGLPLGGVALGQVGGPLAGAARLGGPLLLTGLVWLGGAGIGSVVVATTRFVRHRGAHGAFRVYRVAVIGGILSVAAVISLGAVGAISPDGGKGTKSLTVALVQGGGVRGFRKAQINPEVVFEAQVDATSELRRPAPDLVVWPEDVVSLDGPLAGTPTEAQLSQIARSLDSTFLVGVTETVSSTSFRNEVVGFGPSGSIVGTYEKVHRVPFGEYVPFRGFFEHLANLEAIPQDAIPGHGTGFMRTPAAPIGLMVSYEVFFANAGRSATRAGAQLLVVPTNTSSYSTSQVPTQEVAADRLQAIEEGRDLVQAAPTGYSTVVDNDGRVLERSVLGKRQILSATLELRDGKTVYERFGDLPVLVLAMLGLVLGLLVDLRRRSDLETSGPAETPADRSGRRRREILQPQS